MDKEEFRGFVDDEIIKTSAARRKKLAILDQKVNHVEGQSYSEESTTSPHRNIVRRPPNRFLNRNRVPSGCSDSSKLSMELSSELDITGPISIQNSSQDLRKNIITSTARKENDIEFESAEPVPSGVETVMLKGQISPTAGVPNSDIAVAGTSRRQNKFLKPVLKSTIEVSQVGATKTVKIANKVNEITEDHGRRKVTSKYSKPEELVQEIAPIPTDCSGEETLSVESLASKQRKDILVSGNATVAAVKPVPCLEDVSDKETPSVPKIDLNSCHDSCINEDSKIEATSRTDDQEMPTLRQEAKTEVPITKTNNRPSPAKRTSSVSELSFLTAHTSRSKRTIVPNKRFFSTDSPPVLSKHDEEQVVLRNPMLPLQDVKKSGTLRNSSEFATNKKRSLSGDNVKRKRKPSGDIPLLKEKTTTATSENSSGPQNSLERPRRTIIPNRKFFDDEPTREPSPKKADIVEPKRKRRKSEKIAQIDVIPENPAQQQVQLVVENKNGVTNDVSIPIPDNTSNISGANDNTVESQTAEASLSPPMVNGTNNIESNGSKTDLKIPEVEDEIVLDESEVGLFRGKSIFVGTCIIRESEQIKESKKEQNGFEGGIVYCGLCQRLKKYQILAEKRKRGSFLCADCVVVVNKIFQNALKAKPFTCIIGPPICEGSCPLVFSPEDQFCQACFGKTCLKNLPMKDDIYFKIWRSIPPMSRGCVPTSPVVNTASPYVGKVLRVTANGEILSTSTSLKSLGLKKSNSNNLDALSEDSNTSDAMRNGDVDLNSARITTFVHRTDSSSNCENTVPFKLVDESLHSDKDIKTNGVAKEEILLDRQTGQERVKALIDPMLKPNFEDIEIFGFPVIISSQVYPRKPLCFLCGSAGIKQLIFCSMCCEPFHPYCAGDDLLMDTYISSYNTRDDVEEKRYPTSVDEQESGSLAASDGRTRTLADIPISNTQEVRDEVASHNAGRSHFSKMFVKWTCRRCLRCKSCQESIGHLELIRCKRCRNPFHLQSCIDKGLLSKIKDVDRLKKIWTCDTCLRCKSCGKKIEANRRLQTIQAAEKHEEEDDDESGDESRVCSQVNFLMLCLECFRQRKKGSYCPICEVCYDDNDWDSKMMECVKCNRWIHSKCEKLTDDQYYILGTLPEHIEYSCRLCAPMENPVWYTAVQSQLTIRCNSALRDFEKTAVGDLRKKRSSIDHIKPSFVCNLFAGFGEESSIQLSPVFENSLKSAVTEDDTHEGSCPPPKPATDVENVGHTRLRESMRKETVSCKEIMSCKVYIRDFVKFPQTLEENWYAMKILGVEIVNQDKIPILVEDKMPGTPIYSTPSKCYTPTKNLAIISDTIRQSMNTVQSVSDFKRLMTKAVETRCESEREADVMSAHFEQAVKNVFSWCQQDPTDSNLSEELVLGENEELENNASESDDGSSQIVSTTDPFDEVYWDPIDFFDDRVCALCGEVGDFPAETCGRLLWAGVNEWIHCNCAIWSSEVWELENGALQQVGAALIRGRTLRCSVCNARGATVSCCNSGCKKSYHFLCAREDNCNLLDDKTMICPRHKLTSEQEEDIQHDMKVGRKVFVDLDWLQKRGMKAVSTEIKVFIGSLRIDNLGSIVPISAGHLNWTNPSYTALIPKDYRAQRVFWSAKDPWYKECYTFETSISSNGFGRKVQDVGVNLLVDHSKHERNVLKSIENITKFHKWLQQAPSYIDENFVDWLPPCSENFNEEAYSPNVFTTTCNKAPSSPASPYMRSNYGKVSTKTPSEVADEISDSIESMSTEGYSSSVDSTFNSTPTSSRGIRQKRRRSSCKTRKTLRKRSRLTAQTTLSPRRRSMRNNHMKESAPYIQDDKNTLTNNDDSDNDSGVVDAISSSGSNDGDRRRCRINLLKQFNDSIDEQTSELKHDTQHDYGETVEYHDVSDSSAITVPSSFEENLDVGEKLVNETKVENNAMEIPKTFTAMFKYEVKPKNSALCFKSCNVKLAWMHLFDKVSKSRLSHNLKPLVHPAYNMNLKDCDLETANSYRMMGITHRTVQYLIEQLPDVLNVVDRHKFRYSHRPYVDVDNENVPVPINSTGCARTEGFQQRKPFDMFGWLASRHRKVAISCNTSDESSRGQGLPLAMRFRDLQEKAKKRFVVLHSQIHGRGLYARCDVEKGDMIIEYAGEVIRHSLSDPRESYYESRGIGCYMFRIKTQVIDATLKGNAARFINHSCDPNCEAKTVRILGKDHIIIFAVRKIFKGEELTYDYKFEREEDKIPCTCGAPRCRKYLN